MKLSWKWIAILIVALLLLVYGVSYGYRQYKFYKEKADITDKQNEIVEELEKADLEHIRAEDALIRQLAEKKRQLADKDVEINNLEAQIHNIVVPTDPDDLVNAWNKVGIRARRMGR